MRSRDELRAATRADLTALLARGSAVDAAAIAGWVYRGTSLGLPRWMEALSWISFQKVFFRDDASGRVMGWNVRLEQTGLHGPSRPETDRRGAPLRFGGFEVHPIDAPPPRPVPEGALLLDYGRAARSGLDPLRVVRDPIVALAPGSADVLLGWSYLAIGSGVSTPSYFLLEREHELDHDPPDAVLRALGASS
jgi:hypothetical protein